MMSPEGSYQRQTALLDLGKDHQSPDLNVRLFTTCIWTGISPLWT
jgi:hypothetical protein